MADLPTIQRFETDTGVRIYRIPVEVFPNGFIGFVHLLLNGGVPTLVDTGSGFLQSNTDLLKGLESLKEDFEKPFFMSVGFFRPHVPLFVSPKWFDHYDVATLKLPRNPVSDLPWHRNDWRHPRRFQRRPYRCADKFR